MPMTEEEKRERRKEYNRRYRSSEHGKEKTKEHNLKYQQGNTYRQYKKIYDENKRNVKKIELPTL